MFIVFSSHCHPPQYIGNWVSLKEEGSHLTFCIHSARNMPDIWHVVNVDWLCEWEGGNYKFFSILIKVAFIPHIILSFKISNKGYIFLFLEM